MSYNMYLSEISSENLDKLRTQKPLAFHYIKETESESENKTSNIDPKYNLFHEELEDIYGLKNIFDFGQDYPFEKKQEIEKVFGLEMEDYVGDYNFEIIKKEDLLNIITYYQHKISDYYQNLYEANIMLMKEIQEGNVKVEEIEQNEVLRKDRVNKFLLQRSHEWIGKPLQTHIGDKVHSFETDVPINVNLDDKSFVNSLNYEYIIFDLIRILKTIDFSKKTLIIYGR